MVDPWLAAISILVGTWSVPAVSWPADRRRVVVAADWSEPDLTDLEPEPRTAARDDALLAYVCSEGSTTVRAAAAACGMAKTSTGKALQRLRAHGLVRLELSGWRAT